MSAIDFLSVKDKTKFSDIRRYNVRNYREKKLCNRVCRENQ